MESTPIPEIEIKKSPFRFLLPVLGILILLAVAYFAYTKFIARPSTTSEQGIELVYWGLWEPSEVLASVFKDFEAQNPGITVKYIQQKSQDYRERLTTAIDNRQGPDLFRFHHSWGPMLDSRLTPIPNSVMSAANYESTFYPLAVKSLKSKNGYLGIPLEIDGLGLYYNTKIFAAAGKTPPKDWNELRRLALLLKEPKTGPLLRGGIALGTTNNVEHWPDILGVMMLQNAASLTKPNNKNGQDALTFYTLFSTTDQVWDSSMPPATYAFATEKVAMMIAPSWRAFDIREINPQLEFAIASLPQLPDANPVNWGSFWAEGVNSQSSSEKQAAAWKLLLYLSQKETLRSLYAAASTVRLFGEPFSRIDMADQLAGDPYVGSIITMAPTMQSWYLNSYTHDNGLNDNIIKYYEDALNSMLTGSTAVKSLDTTENGIEQVLNKYRLKP